MESGIHHAEQSKSVDRLLVEAERKIKRLEAKIVSQKETIRDLRAQIRHDESVDLLVFDLKYEISELKVEIKELTRANREHVARFEALRDGMTKRKPVERSRTDSLQSAMISERSSRVAVV